jgi:hypothetical protein
MLVVAVAALVALSVTLASVVATKCGTDSYRFRTYLLAVIVGFFLLAPRTFRLLNLGLAGWFHRESLDSTSRNELRPPTTRS